MKKHIQLALIFFLGISILGSIHSCKKDKCNDPTNPDCENYDPCYGKSPVKAQMMIGLYHPFLVVNGSENFICEDSIFRAPGTEKLPESSYMWESDLGFKCITSGAEAYWKLGSEYITDKNFVRNFPFGEGIMGKYQVRLIVKKEPDIKCFPFDDGIDTLVKTFQFVPNYELPIMGVYKVLFDGDTDSTIIEIRPWAFKQGSWGEKNFEIESTKSNYCLALINFRNCLDTFAHFTLECSYTGNKIQFGDFPASATPSRGNVILNNSNIEAVYSTAHKIKNIPYTQYKFKGRKIL